MNTQHPGRPAITPAMREQAMKQPNTWLYVVDPIFADPQAKVPPWGFIGGYRVDPQGQITDDFSANPHYRPSPVALRLPAPTNDAERALQLTTTGYAQGHLLLTALLDAELILFAQPQGSGLFAVEQDSGRRQVQVFTSDSYLPRNWTTWQRMTGRQLAAFPLAGFDIQINPGSPVKARISGEDLVNAAAAASAPAQPEETAEPSPEAASRPEEQDEGAAADPVSSDFGQRFLGCVLTGAIGDALGAPVEFLALDEIRDRFGDAGVTGHDRDGDRFGEFTDDTQLTLFTLEGLIRGHIAARVAGAHSPLPAVQLAYQRWLHTQGYAWSLAAGPFLERHPEPTGWLITQQALFAVRAPNSACMTALQEFASAGTAGTPGQAVNNSEECSGVARCAPVALWSDDPKEVFDLASAAAARTCSHPNGYLPAGVHAVLIHRLLRGEALPEALSQARALLATYAAHGDTDSKLQAAIDLAAQGKPTPERLNEALGGGWAGHEALAIAVCAALSADDIASAVTLAVNHSGDSDSTAAICGNIVGARDGLAAVPDEWLRDLKLRDVVEMLVRDALVEFSPQPLAEGAWVQRYPAAHDTLNLVFGSALRLADAPPPAAEPTDTPEFAAEAREFFTEPEGYFTEPQEYFTESEELLADSEEFFAEPEESVGDASPAGADRRAGQIVGCLLGGAVGDALGYAVKTRSLEEIRSRHGAAGLTDFAGPTGAISQITQMTLFSLEGLIRASVRRRLYGEAEPATQVQYAYQRWLHTQGFEWKEAGGPLSGSPPDGWLIQRKDLFARRGPAPTSVQALHSYATGNGSGSFTNRLNDSKGCAGVTRAAPTALWSDDSAEVFRVGAVTAALTHGHASGYLPAGAFAVIVQQLLLGRSLVESVDRALTELFTWDGHEETAVALRTAIELATGDVPTAEQLTELLGDGGTGEQALAIAVCAALTYPESFTEAVTFAVNHSGDSASTAAICGNIMGAVHTADAIPQQWREELELGEVTEQLAQDAVREFSPEPPDMMEWLERYPVRDQLPVAQEPQPEPPAEQPVDPDATVIELETAESADDSLSEEEMRLLTAWRKFRDNDDPADVSEDLRKLLVEAFGAERAAQLVGEQQADQQEEPVTETRPGLTERRAGCVLGAAVGDALGAPWMFADANTILRDNPDGVRTMAEFLGRAGTATAVTQQIVFVLDGLLRADIRSRLRGIPAHPPSMVRLALEHWLCTQGLRFEPSLPLGELAESTLLRAQRFPDESCLTALAHWSGRSEPPTVDTPPNAARSSAATARGAVAGFHAPTPEAAISLGIDLAVITHGHPDGYLPAGALAGIVNALADGRSLAEGVYAALDGLQSLEGNENTLQALRSALLLASRGTMSPDALDRLGSGWTGPEALAIGVTAALSQPDSVADAVSLAVAHSGQSAASGAICGSLLGAACGVDAIPANWREELELAPVLEQLLLDGTRVADIFTDQPPPDWTKRYLN